MTEPTTAAEPTKRPGHFPKQARWARFLLDSVEDRLASAMLDAKAGASGPFDSEEQRRRTRLMAEWIIARLPFYDLSLVERMDNLTDEEREAKYRHWLRSSNEEQPR